LSGRQGNRDLSTELAENKLLLNMNSRPTRFIDYYFMEAKTQILVNPRGTRSVTKGDNKVAKQWQNSDKGITMVIRKNIVSFYFISLLHYIIS
jgi:hypothetical protein